MTATPEAPPLQQIRAVYDAQTIRVYQAYGDAIADSALAAGRFVTPPFLLTRMTWIKPSFLWMMYRAGWGHKEPGQARILAIDMTRASFDWAVRHAVSTRDPKREAPGDVWERPRGAPRPKPDVRIQWDPERDLFGQPLPHRAIQIGLGPPAARDYATSWIVQLSEVTALAHEIFALREAGQLAQATALLPPERPYPQ